MEERGLEHGRHLPTHGPEHGAERGPDQHGVMGGIARRIGGTEVLSLLLVGHTRT